MTHFPTSLLDGYTKFRVGEFVEHEDRFLDLAKNGQKPETMIISCCDSRSAPEMIFGTRPGDLFIVRNVANLVSPYLPNAGQQSTSAAIEFAIHGLGVKNIVVMGHSRCGGINASLADGPTELSDGKFIDNWISPIKELAESVKQDPSVPEENRQSTMEQRSIQRSVKNLRTFPFIAEREKNGGIFLYGAWFDVAKAELWTMNPVNGEFSLAP